MSHIIYLVKFVIAYVGLIQFVMTIIPVWLITGRYFDNYWKLKEVYNPLEKFMPLIPKSMHRAIQYTLLIIITKVCRKCLYRKIYGDFPFCERARMIDKIIALIFVLDFFIGLAFALLWVILMGISKIWGM